MDLQAILIPLLVAMGLNWFIFIPAYLFKTDKLTDISYSLTFLILVCFAFWNSQMLVMAHAYYTALTLGVIDKVHQPLFNTVHIDRKLPRNAEEVAELFAKHGVEKEKVTKTFQSFGVNTIPVHH